MATMTFGSRAKKLIMAAFVAASLMLGLAGGAGIGVDDASAMRCTISEDGQDLPCIRGR